MGCLFCGGELRRSSGFSFGSDGVVTAVAVLHYTRLRAVAKMPCCSRNMMGLLCSSCCGLMWLGGGIATLAVLYGSRAPPRQMCYGQFDPVIFLHRGNLTHGQENTLKSVVAGAAALGANPEIDVMSTWVAAEKRKLR